MRVWRSRTWTKEESVSEYSRAFCQTQAVYGPLPNRICGPPVTRSISPSGEIQTAETPGIPLIIALPFAGPSSNKAVESASEAARADEIPLTANFVFRGFH